MSGGHLPGVFDAVEHLLAGVPLLGQPAHPALGVRQHGKGVCRLLGEARQGLHVDRRDVKAVPEIREAQPLDPAQPRPKVFPRPALAKCFVYDVQRRQTLQVQTFRGGSCFARKLPLEILESGNEHLERHFGVRHPKGEPLTRLCNRVPPLPT